MVPVNETVIVTAEDGTQNTQVAMVERMECMCEHGTDGPSCEMCQRDHNSRPWRRATQDDANECKRESSTFILVIRDITNASRGAPCCYYCTLNIFRHNTNNLSRRYKSIQYL